MAPLKIVIKETLCSEKYCSQNRLKKCKNIAMELVVKKAY
jgi:hypothetical protein